MEQKIVCIDVLVTRNGEKCEPLSFENCGLPLLNSILSLCKPGDVMTISMVERSVNAQGMPIKD